MHRCRIFLILALMVACAPAFAAGHALLLISIDGLKPEYLLQADAHGLKIPHLRRILNDGAHASGVRGVLPTVTYPSHTTIVTGVWPSKHGIYTNIVFDPLGLNFEGWYWYAEDIAVPTIWEGASNAGLTVGSVSWPASVGAKGIRYNVPEYWRAQKTPDDLKLMRAISTPGLVAEIAKDAGPYNVDLDDAIPGDLARTRYAAWILRHGKPQLMTVHLAALDHLQHASGPFSSESNATLEQIDRMVGQLEEAMRGAWPDYAICIVSDHGFSGIDHSLNLMKAFADQGLVTLGKGPGFRGAPLVVDWKAFPKVDGGSAAIMLKDPKDEATRTKVEHLLHELSADRANGIAGILDRKAIASMGGDPHAAFWVDMQPGFSVVNTLGPLVSAAKGGTHGNSPSHRALLSSFFIAGPDVERGLALGELDLRNIAPTVAAYLAFPFPSAELKAVALRK
ncbi:MAG TPA: ectonucleotide pyrophosphatase/phosphodiesterase [Bryobacteraceae bacterium]|nr:ectonucleotide pyrophosphatase/phosphodiesterase [Bryobacteraceae bacterium]